MALPGPVFGRIESTVVIFDAFRLCDSHPGEFPGGGNGIPMVHDGELMDSDTGRAFREDGDGSAMTRIWTYRVDCRYFFYGAPRLL